MKTKQGVKISLGLKTTIGIAFMALVLSIVAIVFGYQTYKNALEKQLIKTAYNLAETMASQIEPASIKRYLDSGTKDAAYEETRARLIDIQSNNDIEFAVVTLPTEEGFYYVYDTDQSEDAFALCDFQEFYPGDFLDNKANFLAGNPLPPIITNYEFGWLLSALVPIKDENGTMCGYVDVDLSMNEIKAMEKEFLLESALILAGITLVLALLLLFATRKILVTPINRLAEATGEFIHRNEQSGGTNAVINLSGLDSGDEIGHLYRSIRQMEIDIYAYIENLTSVTAEKERIGAELDVAKHIQASMLPSIFPAFPERPELDIYATMTPAKEVGGDFYDFFLVDDDHLVMVMADVSGKGVPAALFMVIAKTLLKNCAQTGLSPKEVLEKVNNQLCEGNEAELFVTVWLGVYEISTGKLIAANAGHEYPVIKKKNGIFELIKDRHGFVLAGMENSRYKEYELTLLPGDKLYLYTDGVAEATDAQQALFGTDRMIESLNNSKDLSVKDLLINMKRDIDAFVGEAPQFDDITMLGLEVRRHNTAAKQISVKPSLEAVGEVAAFVEAELEAADVPLKTIMQMNIAVDEIFSNIVRYSSADNATVSCEVNDSEIMLRFTDNGTAYDPTQKADPDISLSAEERNIGGLGIYMVKKTMDSVVYESENNLNVLTITKKL